VRRRNREEVGQIRKTSKICNSLKALPEAECKLKVSQISENETWLVVNWLDVELHNLAHADQ
jgi:hypothetical protein